MARWTARRERFRGVLSANRCVHPGSVFDAMSGPLAEDVGFVSAIFAGSVAWLAVLGAPDLIVLTLSGFAGRADSISRAGELPLLVDADHGYGNALNVMRTVEELENAGVAALSIEDTVLPTAFGNKGKPELISIEEGVGKMRAALAARRDDNLVIAGRTSAPSITGLPDTIARLKAYESAGVDALFVVGVKSREDLDAIAAAVRIPIILGSAGTDVSGTDYLAARGVRVMLQGHRPVMAAVLAAYETLKAMREGSELPPAASPELMKRVTRDGDYTRWTRDFLAAREG